MKKLIYCFIFISIFTCSFVYAGVKDSDNVQFGQTPVTIIDKVGNSRDNGHLTATFGADYNLLQKTLVSHPCLVYGWSIDGITTGTWAMLFDGPYFTAAQVNTWSDGGIKFINELSISVASGPVYFPFPNGLYFTKEVSVTRSDADLKVFVYYNR